MEIREYIDDQERSHFAKWFNDIPTQAAAKIRVALARMEQENLSNVKALGFGLYEKRLDFGPGYRVYFGKDGSDHIILLGGGTKSRQQKDIERAKLLWQDYEHRKHIEADKT